MEKKHKTRVGLIFGGRSGEHEVSLASARAVMANLNPDTYEVVPLGITKEGSWLLGAEPHQLIALEGQALRESTAVTLTGDPGVQRLIPIQQGSNLESQATLDVIFPVLHGTYGEDGSLQGLLDMANIPYVGCGVLGAALGMDKEKMKMLFQAVGLPIVASVAFHRSAWERSPDTIIQTLEQQLDYPIFVKPVNLGSSVGITKAHTRDELEQAIVLAGEYDRKIVAEQGIVCREFECAVLGNDEPLASVVGEIVSSNEFYDYRAKYLDGKSQAIIPADIPQEVAEEIRRLSIKAFAALDLTGLARVDFFLQQESGQIYINEVNTMPGFTEISMYPRLWEASGLPYAQMLDRLIELAIERHEDRQRNRTSM